MASDLQTVAQLLQATLDPRQHKQGSSSHATFLLFTSTNSCTAEAALKTEEQKPGFSLILLSIVANESLPLNTRLSAALLFKNFIKFNYVVG